MTINKLVTMREALSNPGYFGTLLSGESWQAWRILLIAIVGEALTPDERAIFTALTGREHEPEKPVEEFWGCIGRRGGKESRAMAVLAAYLAACVDYRGILAPGERGTLPVMAASTPQAVQSFNYVTGCFKASPFLSALIIDQLSDTLRLSTSLTFWSGRRVIALLEASPPLLRLQMKSHIGAAMARLILIRKS